jgi:hopanoid biosynthesis associated RND transporter like protein HpnN
MRRRAPWVIVAALAACAGGLGYMSNNLGMHTNTTDMLSDELPFRRIHAEYKQAFPQFSNTLLVVVDARTVDVKDDVVEALSARMAKEKEFFEVVYQPGGQPFFARNGLLYLSLDELYDLTDQLSEVEPLLAKLAEDTSLRGLFEVLGEAFDDMADGGAPPDGLEQALTQITATVAARVDGAPVKLSWTELISGDEVEEGDLRGFIIVRPHLSSSGFTPAAKAMRRIREIAGEVTRELGVGGDQGVRVRLTGGEALATEELRSVTKGAKTASILSFLLVAVLLFTGLRSPKLVATTLITLIAGLIWTAAFAAFAIGHLNLISVAFAVLFIGLSVDFSIHFTLRYKEDIDAGLDHAQALRGTVEGIGMALTLSAVAAAIAFFSFLPTDYVGLAELGLIAGTGMFIALFANMTLLPAILTVIPLRPAAPRKRKWAGVDPGALIRNHSRAILWGAGVLAILAAAVVPFARFDFNPLRLKDPTTESVQTYFDLLASSRTSPYTISIVTDGMDEASSLSDRLKALPAVDKALTLASYVPDDQPEKLELIDQLALVLFPVIAPQIKQPPTTAERHQAFGELRAKLSAALAAGNNATPDAKSGDPASLLVTAGSFAATLDRFVAAFDNSPESLQLLEDDLLSYLPKRLEKLRTALEAAPVTIDDIPEEVRERLLAPDGRAHIEVYPRDDISDNSAMRSFVDVVRTVAPNATGTPVLLVEAARAVIGSFVEAGTIALVLVLALLFLLLRNLRDALFVLIPLLLAIELTVATATLIGLSFNFANIIVFPLLFGLGVASGIHLVCRRRTGGTPLRSLETSTPRAVVFSALTTIGSFGSLAVSSHRGMASMGEFLTIAIAFTLICTLLVLPALMARFSAGGEKST